MKHHIYNADGEEFYMVVTPSEIPTNSVFIEFFAKADHEKEPRRLWNVFLQEEHLENLVVGLQKVQLYKVKLGPNNDCSKNYGEH
jgi:hypothetical protein